MTETFLFRSVPGPAFIPTRTDEHGVDLPCDTWGVQVPLNYIWQPATDHTMAGWVRARRVTTAPPEAVP